MFDEKNYGVRACWKNFKKYLLVKSLDNLVELLLFNTVIQLFYLLLTVVKKLERELTFFPLTVDYVEKFYSTGKFPGGFNKREGRPSTNATLIARLIDRPIRPMFPEVSTMMYILLIQFYHMMK